MLSREEDDANFHLSIDVVQALVLSCTAIASFVSQLERRYGKVFDYHNGAQPCNGRAPVIAESLAVVVVTLAVVGPGSYLLHVAWQRGGAPRWFAIATLAAMVALVVWLFTAGAPGTTVEDRVSQFAGAWGILFMVVGVVVIAAAALGRFRPHDPRDPEK